MEANHQERAGIYGSLLLKNQAKKESLDKKIKEMGKQASLRYKASINGFYTEALWK